MANKTATPLSHIVAGFGKRNVILVGDTILDEHVYGNEVCKALDVPVPEAEQTHSFISFGGASLVAANILSLGGKVTFFSVVGQDDDARHYAKWNHPNLQKVFLTDKTRKTTVKSRWFIDGKKLLQVNRVDNHYLSAELERSLLLKMAPHVKKSDVVLISDPQHGLLSKNVIKGIKALAKKWKKPVYVDSQISHRPSNYHLYTGVNCAFLNQKEAKAVLPEFDEKQLESSLRAIQRKLHLDNVIVKLGEKGSAGLFDGVFFHTDPHKVKAVDVCGAGDAFFAAFSLCDRMRPKESSVVANTWGALSTTVHGTIPAKKSQLVAAIQKKKF